MVKYHQIHAIGKIEEIIINDVSIAREIFIRGKNKQITHVHVFDSGDKWDKTTKTRNQFGMSNKSVESLCSLLNNQYLSKKYIKLGIEKNLNNLVFPTINNGINNNKLIYIKSLLRPMSFELVTYALFGIELINLNDKFWINFEKISKNYLKLVTNEMFKSILKGKTNINRNPSNPNDIEIPLCKIVSEYIKLNFD